MKDLLLFPGAVVKIAEQNEPRVIQILGKNSAYYSLNNDTKICHVAEIHPALITPEILERLEGPEGERFVKRYDLETQHFLRPYEENKIMIVPTEHDPEIWSYWVECNEAWVQYIHELQNRVFLDAGIIMKLRD